MKTNWKPVSVEDLGKYSRREFETCDSLLVPPWPVSCHWIPQKPGVWNTNHVSPSLALCFRFLLYSIVGHESWPPVWASAFSLSALPFPFATLKSFSTKLCLGFHLSGNDKFQEKPILIELFWECYANMSKLCGIQFHSRIWFMLIQGRKEKEKEKE